MSLNVPIIDVHRENFKDFWPAINLAIQTASFISIDAELSGLGCRRKLMAKSIEDRYKAIAEVARTRSVLSLGISCFKLQDQGKVREEKRDQVPDQANDEKRDQVRNKGAGPTEKSFLVQTFNILTLCNEDYMVEPGALAFLVGHGFDFNKQYSLGIPYYRGLDKGDDKTWPSLRLVFNQMLAAKKPLTLHNGLVDLIFLYQNLYSELPPTSSQFIADCFEMYPGGIVDTKYVAEYEARMPASYLEYVFKKSQRDNELRRARGASHVTMTFCRHSPDLAAVEYQSYALPLNFAERQAQGEAPGTKTTGVEVCEIYAAHGHCSKGKECPKSHDPDAILDSEEIILEEKRKRKRRRRNRKNRRHLGDGEMDGMDDCEEENAAEGSTEEKKAKRESEETKGEYDRTGKSKSAVAEDVMASTQMDTSQPSHDASITNSAKLTQGQGDTSIENGNVTEQDGEVVTVTGKGRGTEPNCVSKTNAEKSEPPKKKSSGSHRAGFDAFMTGFAAAAFMARFADKEKWGHLATDSETDRDTVRGQGDGGFFTRTCDRHDKTVVDRLGLGHHANKLYLSGKEYPLAIVKSSFTKTSANHRAKMLTIEKLAR